MQLSRLTLPPRSQEAGKTGVVLPARSARPAAADPTRQVLQLLVQQKIQKKEEEEEEQLRGFALLSVRLSVVFKFAFWI